MNAEELNTAIAEAMGYRLSLWPVGDEQHEKMSNGEDWFCITCGELPDFVNDLNALRDHPEKRLREAGMLLGVNAHSGWAEARWKDRNVPSRWSSLEWSEGENEGWARALACLPALKALQETAAVMEGDSE